MKTRLSQKSIVSGRRCTKDINASLTVVGVARMMFVLSIDIVCCSRCYMELILMNITKINVTVMKMMDVLILKMNVTTMTFCSS